MLEILFLIGIFGVGIVMAAEYISQLDALPTLLVGVVLVPVLYRIFYDAALTRCGLERLPGARGRRPVPPERFYWVLCRAKLRVRSAALGFLAAVSWTLTLRYPAGLTADPRVLSGWFTGVLAIVTTADAAACSALFMRASEWLDGSSSRWGSRCRRLLSRLSGDRELLDPDPLPGAPERQQRARLIY